MPLSQRRAVRGVVARVRSSQRASASAFSHNSFLHRPPSPFPLIDMSLADASEARKARLLALRRRRAGETVDETG